MKDKIWNPNAIDYSKGVILDKDGTVKFIKQGCFVDSLEYAQNWQKEWAKKQKEV